MFAPTPEQLTIVKAAQETEDNILVSALAGAAKTSTLELIAKALEIEMLLLCFNKRNAVEAQERMPEHVKCMTLNGLGHRTWMDATGRRLIVDKDKTYNLVSEYIKTLSQADQSFIYEKFGEILKIIAFGKACGYVPTGHHPRAKPLMDDASFFGHVEHRLSPLEEDLIRDVTLSGLKMALTGTIDFDDQIFMPTIFHGAFPRYKLTLVDEAQDLSALNHATLRKMVGTRRLIAVGDARQAIYGFRGAHEDSMNKLKTEFNMVELGLSMSFRCPEAIVSHAQWRAPHMRAHRPGGSVTHLDQWGVDDLPTGAYVLCRNNAPLFRAALRLLRAGRHVELGSGDVAKSLHKIMVKFGKKSIPQQDVFASIRRWEGKEKEKIKERGWGTIEDKAACMEVFAEQGDTLGDALAYINHLVNSSGPTKLLTVHKAKGLEADSVFILDAHLIGDDDQEPNLRYVAQTRAKNDLTYITSEGYLA
jgi:DNA helicase-2/ATP-dependent DNA helicase PcrA